MLVCQVIAYELGNIGNYSKCAHIIFTINPQRNTYFSTSVYVFCSSEIRITFVHSFLCNNFCRSNFRKDE